jgi:hypothetical protein
MNPEDKMCHEFVEYVKYKYIAPKLVCFNASPFTDEEMIQRLLMGEYAVHGDKFFFAAAPQDIETDCDLPKTQALAAFVFLLKTMLTQPDLPAVSDMYNFCLKFDLTV